MASISSVSASSCWRPSLCNRLRHRDPLLLRSPAGPYHSRLCPFLPRASKRFSSYPQVVEVTPNSRVWDGDLGGRGYEEEDDCDDDEDEDEDERSLDLLVRFLHTVFRKISRRARRAVRAVLPPAISSKLVGFSVNGVLILASLWILKSFLEEILKKLKFSQPGCEDFPNPGKVPPITKICSTLTWWAPNLKGTLVNVNHGYRGIKEKPCDLNGDKTLIKRREKRLWTRLWRLEKTKHHFKEKRSPLKPLAKILHLLRKGSQDIS